MTSMIALAVGVIAAIGCGSSKTSGTTTGSTGNVENAADADQCTTDEDCTLVEACCGCNSGGKKVGLRLDAVDAYEKGRTARCASTTCPASISTHPSCNAEPQCKKGHCRAQPHMNQADEPTTEPAKTE